MTFEQKIALGGFIISGASFAVAIIGGVLAILGYRKIIKSTDDNARERQEALERAANAFQGIGQNFIKSVKRDKYIITGFMLIIIFGFFRVGQLVFALRDRVKELEQTQDEAQNNGRRRTRQETTSQDWQH